MSRGQLRARGLVEPCGRPGCGHARCALVIEFAAAPCWLCLEPLGFGVPYLVDTVGDHVTHERCAAQLNPDQSLEDILTRCAP